MTRRKRQRSWDLLYDCKDVGEEEDEEPVENDVGTAWGRQGMSKRIFQAKHNSREYLPHESNIPVAIVEAHVQSS